MHYTVYKTINQVNNKIYIGVHKTKNINDSYLGSGKLLKQAILKEGLHNFTKEILFVYDSPNDAYAKERELVTDKFVQSELTYNLIVGGIPTPDWVEERKAHYRRNVKTFLGKKHTPEAKEKIRQSSLGRKHTEETKTKLSLALKGKPGNHQPQSLESNKKRSISRLNGSKVTCNYCNKSLSPQNAKRWHFENCKLNPAYLELPVSASNG